MAYSLAPPGDEMCFRFYQANVLECDLRGQGNEGRSYDHRFGCSPARQGEETSHWLCGCVGKQTTYLAGRKPANSLCDPLWPVGGGGCF